MSDTDVIRITTTADKARVIEDALRGVVNDRDAAGTVLDPNGVASEDPLLDEALAEVTEALGQPERKRRYAQTLLDHGRPKPQRPTRVAGGMHDDYRETHPAYAMIGASRTSSSGTFLVGTDFNHQAYMTIKVKRADLSRSHSGDHWFGGAEVLEVNLSEAQWATLVSATNMGDGVPCTMRWTETDGYVPDYVPITNRREQFNDEVGQALTEAVEALDDILNDPKSTKATREKAQRAKMRLTDSVPFVVKQADRHMEETIEHAKAEVEAYVSGMAMRAGIAALGGQAPISLIESGSEGGDE